MSSTPPLELATPAPGTPGGGDGSGRASLLPPWLRGNAADVVYGVVLLLFGLAIPILFGFILYQVGGAAVPAANTTTTVPAKNQPNCCSFRPRMSITNAGAEAI